MLVAAVGRRQERSCAASRANRYGTCNGSAPTQGTAVHFHGTAPGRRGGTSYKQRAGCHGSRPCIRAPASQGPRTVAEFREPVALDRALKIARKGRVQVITADHKHTINCRGASAFQGAKVEDWPPPLVIREEDTSVGQCFKEASPRYASATT